MSVTHQGFPRLRHCTLLKLADADAIQMIVGTQGFVLRPENGGLDDFLRIKRFFDGRHSIPEIAQRAGTDEESVRGIVEQFAELGLLRREERTDWIEPADLTAKVRDSCRMWSRQIGYHRLFGSLERGEVPKEVFLGWIIEVYHYVASAATHAATAIAHCNVPNWRQILSAYLAEEYDHASLLIESLKRLGVPEDRVREAHPLIGTQSLVLMLSEIGRRSTLGYLTCTSLFEARREDYGDGKASLEKIAATYGYDPDALAPIIDHMGGDLLAGHSGLLDEALQQERTLPAREVDQAINCLHDLKHSFDQFHDQILSYYSDISNYIPRLRVDYFSL
jgi:TENA/THI-4/PQQC family